MTKRDLDPALTRREFAPGDGKRLPAGPSGRTEYLEPSTGLRLRVTPNEARSWVVAYWSPRSKTSRRLKLGNAATVSEKRARKLARSALTAVDEGRDPYLERLAEQDQERARRQARTEERKKRVQDRARRSTTFGDVATAYVEWRRTTPGGKYNRKASPQTLASWGSITKLYLGDVEGKPPEDVTADDFVRVLEGAVKRGPSMGPRVREFLSGVWRWMEARPRVLGVKLPAESPLRSLPRDIGAAAKERDRALSPAELWRFWRAADLEGLPGLALRFSLLTGSRVKEATHLPWDEVDLKAKVWMLAAERNKGARVRVIPLSSQAVDVLDQAQKVHAGPLAFGPPDLTPTMKRLKVAVGGEPWQPRDLRRTAATVAGRLGADPFTVALLLGHANPDTRAPRVTGAYLKWSYDERVKDILARLGAWVEELVNAPEAPGAVAEFRR